MCVFAHEVYDVKRTRILVAATAAGRQVTIYENFVETRPTVSDDTTPMHERQRPVSRNAMILPCPVRAGSEVRLLDLSSDAFRFEDFDRCFAKFRPTQPPCCNIGCGSHRDPEEFLKVQPVGAYIISVANSVPDLRRIDPSLFTVPTNIDELMTKHYPIGFAFVICAFDATKSMKAHPVGYVHDPISATQLFVPCRHEHGHGTTALEHFDHSIYSIGTLPEGNAGLTPVESEEEAHSRSRGRDGRVIKAKLTIEVYLKQCPILAEALQLTDVEVKSNLTIRRAILEGEFANADLVFTLQK